MSQNKLEVITNLFEENEIRSVWDVEKEDYFFSVVDVIDVLANPKDASDYWTTLKKRLLVDEGSELPTKCWKLKMLARDITIEEHPKGLNQNMNVAKKGGKVALDARKSYEEATKKSAISKENSLSYKYVDEKLIEKKID